MSVITGNSGIVAVALQGSVAQAVGEVRSFSIEETADTVETTAMGDTTRKFIPSFKSGTVSIEALFDVDTASTQQSVLDVGAEVAWNVLPTGDAADEGYLGDGIVTSKSISVPYDDMVTVSFTIQTSGPITAG